MSATVTDAFTEARELIDYAGQRTDLPPEERLALLREYEAQLSSLLGLVGRYRSDAHLEQETAEPTMQEAILILRSRAADREELIESGGWTPEQLDEVGILSFEDIDRLEEEGLLEAWALEEWPHIIFDPLKHPRGTGGKWADVLGRVIKPKGRKGRAVPIPKPPKVEKDAQRTADRTASSADRTAKAAGDADRTAQQVTPPEVKEPEQRMADTLKQVQKDGLNGWPVKDETATKILGDFKDTQELHQVEVRGSSGGKRYTPERKKLHDSIIDTLLRDRMPVQNAKGETEMHPNPNGEYLAANRAEGEKPRALLMAGGTASGKSTALGLPEAADATPPKAVHIDPDEIKAMIPEYVQLTRAKSKYAASAVHEESSDLAKRLHSEAVARGLNIVLDGTGDSGKGKFADKAQSLHDAGYQVEAFYVNAPVDVAIARAVSRAERTGRWVPEPEIRSQHKNVSARFPEIHQLAVQGGVISRIRMYQTEATPTLFAEASNGAFHIHDPALYDSFLAKATE